MRWQLNEAKNKLSHVVKAARDAGPQTLTVHGREAVVVVAAEEYRSLTRHGSLVEFLRRSPLAGVKLDIERSRDVGRPVDL